MIRTTSRYGNQEVTFYLDGRTQTTRPTVIRPTPRPVNRSSRRTSIRWQQGVRIDRISARLYGSPDKWWVILDENPDILDPLSIEAGTTVLLP